MYTLIYSVWQLWRGSAVCLWWPPVCYEGISHIPQCIVGFHLRLITLAKNNIQCIQKYTFLNKASVHLLYNVHTSRMHNYNNTDSSLIFETNYTSSSKWWLTVATHTQLSSVSLDQTWTSRENHLSIRQDFFLTCSSSLSTIIHLRYKFHTWHTENVKKVT